MILDDLRKIAMLDWLGNDLQLTVNKCEPASSDASFRRYFRITLPDRHLIVMDAPPEKENVAAFIEVDELLARSGVKVPIIYHQNLEDGFLVLEDFGSQSFLDKLSDENVDILYNNALDTLLKLQLNTDIKHCNLPRYDDAFFRRELGIFKDWFIRQRLDIDFPELLWDNVCQVLVDSALEQPTTCVHRDFHSRNLMLLVNGMPGIIDFQDAVVGPVTYDLVSLLRDCYIAWPAHRVDGWMAQYWGKLKSVGLVNCEQDLFKRWFDFMGMQRHLKAIGIFSRLDIRDGKSGYLDDIPRTLNYVMAQTQIYPELAEFHQFLSNHVLPQYMEIQ